MSTPRILFVCVHNAGRSQMAAAFARRLAGDRARVLSGGSDPAERLHPVVVEAMREVGIDLAGERPRRATDDDARTASVVVTMGCGDACPVVPGAAVEDWPVADPAGRPLEEVRLVRDEVRARVAALLATLGVSPPWPEAPPPASPRPPPPSRGR